MSQLSLAFVWNCIFACCISCQCDASERVCSKCAFRISYCGRFSSIFFFVFVRNVLCSGWVEQKKKGNEDESNHWITWPINFGWNCLFSKQNRTITSNQKEMIQQRMLAIGNKPFQFHLLAEWRRERNCILALTNETQRRVHYLLHPKCCVIECWMPRRRAAIQYQPAMEAYKIKRYFYWV